MENQNPVIVGKCCFNCILTNSLTYPLFYDPVMRSFLLFHCSGRIFEHYFINKKLIKISERFTPHKLTSKSITHTYSNS